MALSVKFYQRPEHMTFLSDKEGRPIYEPRDYVRIEIPGMVANVVDTLANEDHKRAHPMEWAQYLNEKASGQFSEYQGTLLTEWPQLNSAQVMEMRHYKFYTVEQVADASDQQIQGIGMLAGMSPLSLRDKARAWLDRSKGEDSKVAALEAELAELKALVAGMAKRPKKETADA